ncbi:UNVERIFIED_CONTAM: hypothetical protein Sradi_3181500 [Sesamum radiatum]|uniref:CCHC-type domain-containing protein n=1 Tax=Sesamum radiatum TaxID=300843 RepID=A0AAW2RFQ4_SESRA
MARRVSAGSGAACVLRRPRTRALGTGRCMLPVARARVGSGARAQALRARHRSVANGWAVLSLPRALLEEFTHEQRLTFEKWHEDNRKEHGVKMLSLVEKLKDLRANLAKETYIGVILQSLPTSFDSFIMNYNMNGLDKYLHELINMLVQYETTIEKSAPVGEASTSKAKGKGAQYWRRKKGKTESTTVGAQSAPVAPLGMGKGKRKAVRQSWIPKDICVNCREMGHWKRECPKLLSNQGIICY